MIQPKFLYKSMKNTINSICLLVLILISLSCKKSNKLKQAVFNSNTDEIRTDSIKLIKDTILFVNSSEGEDVKFSINNITQDSIIESEVMGETGKSVYKFIFNKELKTGECDTHRYSEPIYINSSPKIKLHTKENLFTSPQTKERLQKIFNSYAKIFFKVNLKKSNRWNGVYSFSINEDSDDWRNIHEIKLTISKDSITYLAKGFQLYEYYMLSSKDNEKTISLNFFKGLDNTENEIHLQKTKDFGTIGLDGKDYVLQSPYIDINLNDGKKQKYKLKKLK